MRQTVGDGSRNRQLLVRKTNRKGNHPFAGVWILQSSVCRHTYESNSCDLRERQSMRNSTLNAHGIQTMPWLRLRLHCEPDALARPLGKLHQLLDRREQSRDVFIVRFDSVLQFDELASHLSARA